jgi:hypothetical protein
MVSPPGKLIENGSPCHQPTPNSELLEVLVEPHAVAVGAGVVLPEALFLHDRQATQGRRDDLRRLPGPRVVAGDQHVGGDLARRRQAFAEPLRLQPAEIGKPAAGPVTADDPGHGGVRLAVADEEQAGHVTRSYFSFARDAPSEAAP